ncbi:MAG: antibiotic biosynthesis monooxygenase [Chloroflexi bacterium]|nr:antibiotic biosynthesis monooxygenase [Chloroflexota bacterium]
MIRVIIERRLKEGKRISQLIRQLRVKAMGQKGHVSSEVLIDAEDSRLITVVATWSTLDHWKTWETSEQRAAINQEIQPLLTEPPVVKTYRVLSGEELDYMEDPEGWLRQVERTSFDG